MEQTAKTTAHPTTRIVAVDVCGTLFDTNTTAGLVRHHHRRMGYWQRSLLLKLISGRGQPLRAACLLVAKITSFDLHRAITLYTLRGQNRYELRASAESYLQALNLQRIDVVHDRLRQMQRDGWSPILVSNSIEVIVGPIAATLGVPFVSSQLGWAEGRCTGALCVDLTGQKRRCLEDFLQHELTPHNFSVITDNKSDLDLIDVAQHAVIVAHGTRRDWMDKKHAEIVYI